MIKCIKVIDEHFEEILCAMTFLVFVILSNAQVIFRYVLPSNLSPVWTEEIARYFFVWCMFLGFSWCVKNDEHLKVDIIKLAITSNTWRKMEIFNNVIIFCISVVMLIYGWQGFQLQYLLGQTLPASDLPTWLVNLAVPVSSVLVALRSIQRVVKLSGKGV